MSKKWVWLRIVAVMLVAVGPIAAETIYSDGWVPPRLVEGVWVTSGVSDEMAKEYAGICNKGKSRDEVRQSEWNVYWRWHWDEGSAPEWAIQRGEGEEAAQSAVKKTGWQAYYGNQSLWGQGRLGQYGQSYGSSGGLPALDSYGTMSKETGRAKTTWVSGYTRKDGTRVRGHWRSR